MFANPKVLFANPKVLFANQKALLANPKVLLANPKALLAVELNVVGGTYNERCKTRLYWPVSNGVTAWQHPQLVTREGVLKSMMRQSGSRELRGQNLVIGSVLVIGTLPSYRYVTCPGCLLACMTLCM